MHRIYQFSIVQYSNRIIINQKTSNSKKHYMTYLIIFQMNAMFNTAIVFVVVTVNY